ncbi:hypothetical protein JCM11641_001095 [Rhodosporidiobolus odoratus]
MAPVVPDVSAPVPPIAKLPKFHLRVLDLAHPGAQAFFHAVPNPSQALRSAAESVLSALYPPSLPSTSDKTPPAAPPPVRSVTLHLHAFEGVAYTCGSDLDNEHKELHLSLSYLEGVSSRCRGDLAQLKHEIEGVLVHELVHAFQYDGEGSVPSGVIEGIADWVREQAGVGAPHWREKVNEGERWDAGYEKTGYFLRWLSVRCNNPLLVPQINLAMHTSRWDGGKHLKRLLEGQEVEDLWDKYRRELEKKDHAEEEDPPKPVPTHAAKSGYNVQY